MNPLNCVYAEICSGCDWIRTPYANQREKKVADLSLHLQRAMTPPQPPQPVSPLWPEIRWIETQNGGMRTRMDLTVECGDKQVSGLYSRERQELVDLESCAQLTPELNQWLQDFRKIGLNVKRGSVRLRVKNSRASTPDLSEVQKSNDKFERGIWLDLANIDVKRLLDERVTLDQLRQVAVVEIGQRRKRLIERDGLLKLTDPVLENWFDTYDVEGKTIPLYSSIGTFTQPGPIANRALVSEVLRMLASASIRKIAEFGSGIGNFTVPLASMAEEVRAFEIDELALEGLSRSLAEAGLAERVQIYAGNYQVSRKNPPPLDGLDAILVDPPRSGIGKFLDPIAALPLIERPIHFVYVSCFAESFAFDSKRLMELGYEMKDLAIVDQFPQSHHYEVVSRFERREA